MTRVLVIEHEADDPISWLEPRFTAAGVRLVQLRGHAGDAVPQTLPAGYAGLIVLGGYMGANDDADHPWLAATKALIRDTVARGIPHLGICLGHQLTTVALGGQVHRNPAGRALGPTPVRLTQAGQQDPLLRGTHGALALQYNDDVASDLPEGSSLLATAPDGTVQAARFGPVAWGVQFHPEVTPELFERWVRSDSASLPQAEAIMAAADAARGELERTWLPFADRFASLVVDQARKGPGLGSAPPVPGPSVTDR